MAEKFPTLDVVIQSSKQMFSFRKGLAITVGMFVALAIIMFALIMVLFSGVDSGFFEAALNGDITSLPASNGDSGGIFTALLPLLIIIGFFVAYAWVFNMWIRFGAFGAEGAFFNNIRQGIGAAVITALKLFFLSIFLGIVAIVFVMIAAALGIISVDSLSAADTPVASIVMSNLISIAVVSGVYSLFSSNLTQTALSTDAEEIGPPHVFEFGLVLFSLNAALLIPLALLQLVVPIALLLILQFIGSLWLVAAVPLAHGIRYDWQRQTFAGETAAQQFNLDSDDQQQPDDDENR